MTISGPIIKRCEKTMSNYERNTSMILCILGVLIIGSIAIGAITFYGSTNWTGFDNTPVQFHEDRAVGSVTGPVRVVADVGTGSVSIIFINNDTLLYKVDAEMTNRSYQQYGEPTITFSSNTLTVSHEVAGFNITLGNGVNYTIDATTNTGSISCLITDDAMVGDVALTTGTGSISITMANDVTLIGNPDFDFSTSTGSITAVIVLPADVGADFEASVGTGTVTVTAPAWNQVTSSHYRTDDYGTALHNLDIIAETGTGTITATLA
jgi:hypothetical protein